MPEPRAESAELVERACEVMHDAYELAAVTQGWETQERSRKPWADVPEANKETMRAAVRALLDWLEATEAKHAAFHTAVCDIYALQCPPGPVGDYVDRGAWMAHTWWSTVLGGVLADVRYSTGGESDG